jgi:RNA polymerase sigma-70 factor (ECF subfamily)
MTATQVDLSRLTFPLSETTEPSLVERVASAEPAAIGEVYDAHHGAVRAFALRLLGDDASAEDVVHDVFVNLPKAVRRFRGDSTLRTFLISVAANHARHHVRSARRRRAASDRLSLEPQASASTPEQDARRMELCRALARAMDTLSLDHRLAFVLCEIEERSSREAAEILGIPDATVRTRCHHAKKRLRAALEKEGLQ